MSAGRLIVCGRQPWNREHFDRLLAPSGAGEWIFCATSEELARALAVSEKVRYLFFLHWSEIVPEEIVSKHECVCFHMTDVPYGRGGSPLQNLIVRGHRETKLTALRMTKDVDAGPVYCKEPLCLEGSTAEEIYLRASELACEMALRMAAEPCEPVEQTGEVVPFPRRKPAESQLPEDAEGLLAIYDFIRMLDAEGYPHAFLDLGKFRLEFRKASLYQGEVTADVRIFAKPTS